MQIDKIYHESFDQSIIWSSVCKCEGDFSKILNIPIAGANLQSEIYDNQQ